MIHTSPSNLPVTATTMSPSTRLLDMFVVLHVGMRVIPYINGQLYDTRIPRWTKDHANISNQKFLVSGKSSMATNTSKPGLNPHLEHFDGITSAVMCPHTEYWHGVMVDTMVEIVNEVPAPFNASENG